MLRGPLLIVLSTVLAGGSPPDLATILDGRDAAFVLLDARTGSIERWRPDRCAEQLSPCSTFKIPHALIGLETGVLEGIDSGRPWDGVERSRGILNRDHTLRSAIRHSVVWFFQESARGIGSDRMQRWVDRLEYGNGNLASGLDRFWLGGSLAVSADEQVEFVDRLRRGALPIDAAHQAVVRECLLLDRFQDGRDGGEVALFGKTGSVTSESPGADLGWFVGWVAGPNRTSVFAMNVRGDGVSGATARRLVEAILRARSILPPERPPPVRIGHVAATVGKSLVVAGGIENVGGASALPRVDRLDLSTGRWSRGAPMPTPRAFAAAAALGDWIYVMGGLEPGHFRGDGCSARVERYHPELDVWERVPDLPTARSRLAACALNDRIVAIGGLECSDGGAMDSTAVEAFDPAFRIWTGLPDLPSPRHAHAAASLLGRIFVVGGFGLTPDLRASDRVDSLAVGDAVWRREPDLLDPRGWCVAGRSGDRILVAGGSGTGGAVESMDPLTRTWGALTADVEGRRFAATIVDRDLVLVGGEGRDAGERSTGRPRRDGRDMLRLGPSGWFWWNPSKKTREPGGANR